MCFWDFFLSINLSHRQCGVTETRGEEKSGPQGVSTQRINLLLGEDDKLGLAVMIELWRIGRKE